MTARRQCSAQALSQSLPCILFRVERSQRRGCLPYQLIHRQLLQLRLCATDWPHDVVVKVGGGSERISMLGEDLQHVVGQVAASQIQMEDGVGEGITFTDGDGPGHTITRVHHDISGTPRGVQKEHSLDSDVHGGDVEGLDHDLRHLLTIGLGVEGSLSQQNGAARGPRSSL